MDLLDAGRSMAASSVDGSVGTPWERDVEGNDPTLDAPMLAAGSDPILDEPILADEIEQHDNKAEATLGVQDSQHSPHTRCTDGRG